MCSPGSNRASQARADRIAGPARKFSGKPPAHSRYRRSGGLRASPIHISVGTEAMGLAIAPVAFLCLVSHKCALLAGSDGGAVDYGVHHGAGGYGGGYSEIFGIFDRLGALFAVLFEDVTLLVVALIDIFAVAGAVAIFRF